MAFCTDSGSEVDREPNEREGPCTATIEEHEAREPTRSLNFSSPQLAAFLGTEAIEGRPSRVQRHGCGMFPLHQCDLCAVHQMHASRSSDAG